VDPYWLLQILTQAVCGSLPRLQTQTTNAQRLHFFRGLGLRARASPTLALGQ
jgi:hypothetical protein